MHSSPLLCELTSLQHVSQRCPTYARCVFLSLRLCFKELGLGRRLLAVLRAAASSSELRGMSKLFEVPRQFRHQMSNAALEQGRNALVSFCRILPCLVLGQAGCCMRDEGTRRMASSITHPTAPKAGQKRNARAVELPFRSVTALLMFCHPEGGCRGCRVYSAVEL